MPRAAAPRFGRRPGRHAASTRAASSQQDDGPADAYLLSAGFVDYYELLQVDDDASGAEIKAAYRSLAKVCHPDIRPGDGHNVCILLNEAYSVLSDPDERVRYDAQLQQALEDDADDYTGTPLSKWCANSKMGKNEDPAESRAVFVDEATCIGCKQCVWCAPATFRMEAEHGRSRVFGQWLDNEDDTQAAIDSCPVSCIHWVEKEQLPALEYAMQNLVPRENVGMMMAGMGKPVADVFTAATRFIKQREEKLKRAEANKRYSAAQERARRAAAEAVAEQQQSDWFTRSMGSMFGFQASNLGDRMRGNMGYRPGDEDDGERVGSRRRARPRPATSSYDSDDWDSSGDEEDYGGMVPPERALVPVSVASRGSARELDSQHR